VSYDKVCKILAEKYPTDFARWLLAVEPRSIEVLKTELSIEPIRADSLTFLQTENRILLGSIPILQKHNCHSERNEVERRISNLLEYLRCFIPLSLHSA